MTRVFAAFLFNFVAFAFAEEPKPVFDVVLLTQGDSPIQSIKAVREATPGLGLAEALNLVKAAPKTVKSGASKEDAEKLLKALDTNHAKAEIRDAAGKVIATTTPAPVVPGTFDLVLKSYPADSKIMVIKLVRDVTGLGLADAKKLVESAPATIKPGMSNDDAQKYKRLLEANQAVAEVKESAK